MPLNFKSPAFVGTVAVEAEGLFAGELATDVVLLPTWNVSPSPVEALSDGDVDTAIHGNKISAVTATARFTFVDEKDYMYAKFRNNSAGLGAVHIRTSPDLATWTTVYNNSNSVLQTLTLTSMVSYKYVDFIFYTAGSYGGTAAVFIYDIHRQIP